VEVKGVLRGDRLPFRTRRRVAVNADQVARCVEARGRALADQVPLGRVGGDEREQRAIDRVDRGRDDADPAEPEGEDRILVVAGVVVDRAGRGQQRQVGPAAERPVQLGEEDRRVLVGSPGVLEPARPGLGVGLAPDPAGGLVATAPIEMAREVPAVGEGVAAGGVVERLRVRQPDRRELRGSPEVDERRGRFDPADPVTLGILPEGSRVAVAGDRASGLEPGCPSRRRRCPSARGAW
jgi:hypothetical protein